MIKTKNILFTKNKNDAVSNKKYKYINKMEDCELLKK